MKKSFIYALVIALLAVGVYYLLHTSSQTTVIPTPNVEEEETPKPNETALVVDKSLSTEKTYNDSQDKYTLFKVSYPIFKNASDSFNQKIAAQVNAGIAEQKESAEDNWKARFETQSSGENILEFPKTADKFYFNVSWKPIQENDKFISILLTVSAYSGGAHGYETVTSYNYDVVNKKEVALADLYPGDANYLRTISDYSRKDLTAQFRKKLNIKTKSEEANFSEVVVPMMQQGTTPELENFSVFTFTDDAVTFYFNQYQVAPYAMGSSTVTMPRN